MSHVKTIHNLSELKPGQSAVIEGFDEDKVPIKILEMGLLPGNTVLVKRIVTLW
jgi:Fe2+ transport system protein FeoA